MPQHHSFAGCFDQGREVAAGDKTNEDSAVDNARPLYTLPMLVTTYAGDRVVPPAVSQRVSEAFKDSVYVKGEGGNHAPVRLTENIDDKLTKAVLEFFASQVALKKQTFSLPEENTAL